MVQKKFIEINVMVLKDEIYKFIVNENYLMNYGISFVLSIKKITE